MSQTSSIAGRLKLISVITVARNAETTIATTIASVAENKASDVEYIIIDGASNDGTVEIIKKHAQTVDRWISEPDGGLYDAMNKGIALARGRWLYFLNAGDRLRPNMLNVLLDDLMGANYPEELRPKIVSGRVNIVDEDGNSLGYTHPEQCADTRSLLKQNCIAHQATLIDADLFRLHGSFGKDYRIMGDYEFWLRLMKAGVTFHFCSHVVADFARTGISSRRSSFLKSRREQIDILVRHGYMNKIYGELYYALSVSIFQLKCLIRSIIGPAPNNRINMAHSKK